MKKGCKNQSERIRIHRFLTRANIFDDHHLNPKGPSIRSNMLFMDLYRHRAWHLLFRNKAINVIITSLKTYNNVNRFMESINNYYKWNAFRLLFGFKNLKQVIELLERVKSIKENRSKILEILKNVA